MKKILSLLLVVVMIFAFVACGNDGNQGETYEVKISHVVSETDDVHLGFVKLKEMLEEKSDGRFNVNIYSNAALAASDDEQAELVNSDSVQIACVAAYNVANLNSNLLKFNVLDLPYLFETDEDYYKFIDSDAGKELFASVLDETGNIWAQANYIRSWQALTTTKKPARVPSDLKGKSILCGSPEVFRKTVEAWGGNVGTVAWSETYTAMQQGSVDGNLRAVNLSITQRFYEVQKYCTLVNQSAMVNTTLVSKSWYDSLPEDLQAIFDECMLEYEQIMRDYGVARQDTTIQELKDNGVEVIELTDAEKEEWVEAAKPVWDAMEATVGADLIQTAKDIVGK